MSRRHYALPPLTTLCTFEAAARHLSFKNAAQELSVTPGAVSHQIKALEEELGVVLFERQHRGVQLTSEGEALADTLAASFHKISRQLSRIRSFGGDNAVTVGSTTAVASLWLSPAVVRFWREHSNINVHQITQDRPFESAYDVDFYIRYGRDPNPELEHAPLFRDELIPVASPDLAAAFDNASLAELAKQWLIHLDSPSRSWTTWGTWFQEMGYKGEITTGVHVTSYSVALQLARKGAGIALGWRRLVQPMLKSGKLMTVGAFSLPAPHQFHIVSARDDDLSDSAKALHAWLTKEVSEGTV